jgi:molecular chaperone GrpE
MSDENSMKAGAEPTADAAGETAVDTSTEWPADFPPPDDFVETVQTEVIAQLQAECAELKDKLLRALAETENVRRRAERDRKDAEAYGGTRLARDIMSVHDNLGRALAHVDDAMRAQATSLIEGVEMTQRELLSAFAKHKIEMVNPVIGEKFDPNLHQAMFEAPIPGATPGAIIEVMQPGFTIATRLLRPAMVGVAKAMPQPAASETQTGEDAVAPDDAD